MRASSATDRSRASAVLAAVSLWKERLAAKHIVVLCDNEGAKGAILAKQVAP